jgi:lipid-A-disaccharide synthase
VSAGAAVRIAMVAGEASGDLLGSRLIRAIRAEVPHAEFFGIGGPKMIAEGFDSWFPQEKLAVRGLVEVLRHLRELLAIRRRLITRILAAQPRLFVGVDAPDFNLGVERRLKQAGIPAAHFVGPTVWAWRKSRIRAIRRAVSHMLVLFPFEEPIYRDAGIPVTFTGHPLADEIPDRVNQAAVRDQLRLFGTAPVIALLPGSRQSEIDMMAPLFIAAARLILERLPDARFLVPLVTRESRTRFEEALWRADAQALPLTLLFGHAQDALGACDVALATSGTVTLEAALLRRPMVISYRVSPLTAAIVRRLALVPYAGLPNILNGDWLVPEFIQEDATPENLAQATLNLLGDATVRERLDGRFAAIHATLRRDAATQAARALMPYLGGAPGGPA